MAVVCSERPDSEKVQLTYNVTHPLYRSRTVVWCGGAAKDGWLGHCKFVAKLKCGCCLAMF